MNKYRVISKDFAYIGLKDFESEQEAHAYAKEQESNGFIVKVVEIDADAGSD